MSASLLWLWVPITLWAAFAQTVRNLAQKSLTRTHGTLPATLVRFAYGWPFALLWLGAVVAWTGADLPAPNAAFFGWTLAGALGQIFATAALLAAMDRTNFAIASAYSKTEVLQVAVFAVVLLGEPVTAISAVAIFVATIGVLLVSAKGTKSAGSAAWLSRAAGYGIASGALFAIAAVGFRGATVALGIANPVMSAAYTLAWALGIQTLALGAWLLATQKDKVFAVMGGAWKLSLLAGLMGSAASVGWFTAFAMRNAPDVRALGLIEVFFSWLFARRLFGERTTKLEGAGMALLVAGLAILCLQL